MAYVMLLSPSLQQIAHADTNYSSLDISTWGSNNTTITYGYDDNGSLTSKITSVTSTSEETEIVDYIYNLQGRLETVTTAGVLEDLDSDTYDDDRYVEVASYTYSPGGIRASADLTRYDVTDYGEAGEAWAELSSSTTDYLIDPYNHTGHAQVIEETTDDGTDLTRIQYTIGDDIIAQTESTSTDSGVSWTVEDVAPDDGIADTEYLLYDGHGSTRQLANTSGTVIDDQNYSYDGYGVMLSDDSAASGADVAAAADTTMLYAGEQYDSSASMYYNRARYYNPANGLFNRVDPYAGNTSDPQSLHKYAYCHNNPVNGIDPTGMFTMIEAMVTMTNIATLSSILTPALVGSYAALKYDVSFLQIGKEMLSPSTWGEVLLGLGISFTVGFALSLICKIVSKFFTQVVGFALSVWNIIKVTDLLAQIESLSAPERAHAIAVIAISGLISTLLLLKQNPRIDQNTTRGKYPSWSTVRNRYWRLKGMSSAPKARVKVVERGVIKTRIVSKELHHTYGRTIKRPHRWENIQELWPWEHAKIDSNRHFKLVELIEYL